MNGTRGCRRCLTAWRIAAQPSWRADTPSASRIWWDPDKCSSTRVCSCGRLPPGDSKVIWCSMKNINDQAGNLTYSFCLSWLSTDVLALLLTDALIFLQEKDQKYTFATVVRIKWWIMRETVSSYCAMWGWFICFSLLWTCSGPETSSDCPTEVNSSGSSKRRERHVFDQRLSRRTWNVRGPHVIQRGAKHVDEAH